MVDHTSENIGGALKEICEEWDLLEKVCCIVTDNAPNIVKAVKDMNVIHIPCFAHSLNLVVQNALKNTNDVKKVQEKVKAIVSFFHHSLKLQTSYVPSRYNKEKDAHRRELYETFPLGLEVRARLDRKFSGLERGFILAVGTLLDPRFKKLHFIDKGNINEVQEKLVNSVRARSDSQEPVPAPATQAAQHQRPTQPERQLDLWEEHDEIVKECLKAVQPACVGPNVDMRSYLEEGIIAQHEDPLRWWKNHSQSFPLLQEKAKHYLCIPATSVPSE
ncbi:uncharacterized protein LOC143028969 [Oratosquilla oratoria]|uniref:uncharacterized protein LOC143028969 n=1 Tax=Oratosquilla oratoria TaxID=337810 RepID=UPI003F76F111